MKLPSNSVASSNLSTPIPAFFTPKLSFRHGNLPSNSNPNSLSFLKPLSLPLSLSLPPHRIHRFIPFCSSNSNSTQPEASGEFDSTMAGSSPVNEGDLGKQWNVEVRNPNFPRFFLLCNKFSLSDQAFFLLSFIACTTSVAFISFVVAAVPTLYAMGRAATSLAKLADTAREELPSTMAAIRLSGMEISDLTLELSDLSQEISEGVSKSTQAVQAAEAGIRRIGTLARQQTLSMIEERANLPDISLQPVVTGAAKKTSRAVGHATRTLFNFFSGREESYLEDDEDY